MVVGHDVNSSVLDISSSDLHHVVFFSLSMLKIGVGFSICCVLL